MTRLVAGEVREAVVLENLSRGQIVQYAGASGDCSPQHVDEVYARNAGGYPTVFAHGMLTMGATGRAVTDLVGDGTLVTFGFRFLRQVWPGDTITARLTCTGEELDEGRPVVRLEIESRNQHGQPVGTGYATALVTAAP